MGHERDRAHERERRRDRADRSSSHAAIAPGKRTHTEKMSRRRSARMFELALEQGHAQLSLLATAIATNQQDRVVHPMLAAQDALAMARAISGAVPDGARRLAALELALAPLIAQASITGQSGEAADGCFADTTAPSAGDTIDHLVAQTATSGVARSLPYLDRIQQSFGAHDISQIRMFDDAPARRGAAFLGARAFTYGDAIATGTPLDLHTAAHEAAHVVQQRAGLTPTTTLERHADAVADAVVAGRSAERLLDRVAPSRHRGPARAFAIQRKNEVGEVHGDQDQLGIELDHGTERVAFLIPLTYPQKGAFVADPQLATRLARDIAYAFTRNGHPRFESAAFLSGRAISSLITRDLTTWLASKSLPATNAYLDQRSAALDGLQLLAPLERWIVSQGIGVGTVDWNAILPGLLAVPTAADASHFEASSVERYRTFLLGIANEASRRPSVTGATATAAQLSPLLRKYATALPESELGSTVRTHSEA